MSTPIHTSFSPPPSRQSSYYQPGKPTPQTAAPTTSSKYTPAHQQQQPAQAKTAAAAMSFESVMPPYNASDPGATFLSSSCLDFLLIELVPLAYRVTSERESSALLEQTGPAGGGAGGGAGADGLNGAGGEDEETDAVHHRLETQGYRVGQGLVERFSRDRPRFNDTLDVIKFLCKDLWSLVFGKNIDNLKTNHRGVYVLTDNHFRPFARMSTEAGGQAIVRAQPFLSFPCGVVRGALAALGIVATVQAEINELPGAVFQIKTISAKS